MKDNQMSCSSLVPKLPRQKGRLADKYIIWETIGRGSFASVKMIQRKSDGTFFAAKIMRKKKLKPREIQNLYFEVIFLEKLKHPNIICLIETIETQKSLYMVQELLYGGDLLEALLTRGRFSEVEAANVIRQVANACEYMHKEGVAHRDLKLDNIVYRYKECTSVCVIDFGLAQFATWKGELMKEACGTPGYVAPEILKLQGYDCKVDLWSLGVILYILLCGFPPFVDRDRGALSDKIKAGSFSFISPHWDGISSGAKDCVEKLLEVNPKRRLSATAILNHPWISVK